MTANPLSPKKTHSPISMPPQSLPYWLALCSTGKQVASAQNK